MGFWHTGYMEFHEPAGLAVHYRPSKVRYACQHCAAKFDSMESLSRHRFEAHPLARPMLFVRGTELGATPFRITRRLVAADVLVEKATIATLNGVAVRPSELPTRLADLVNDRVTVHLANEGTGATFELYVQVAQEDDLLGVESAFMKMARARTLSIVAIEGFIADCRPYASAGGYYDGICHYLYGVLAKERSADSSLTYDEYRLRYSRAADELKGFDRPLSQIIRALVAFHFNHFEDAQTLAPSCRLQHAAVALGGVLEGWPWQHEHEPDDAASSALEDLLTDHETLRLLRWAAMGANELKSCGDDIAAQLKRDVPSFDRLKLQVMLAEAQVAQGNSKGARQSARELLGNSQTTAWAEALLARLGPKEDKI